MKKALLLLCGLTLAAGINNADAQSFVTSSGSKDTVSANFDPNSSATDLDVKNPIHSTSATPVTIKWKITSYSLGQNWTFDGFCDNGLCYSGSNVLAGSYQISEPYTQSPQGDFKALFGGLQNAPVGSWSYVRVNAKDTVSGFSRDLTFVGTKNNLGVNTVVSYDDVTLFPNPAREAVNVIFNEKAGIKTIAIYNLIGKVMNVYRTTDNASAKLDIDNIPAGVYFLRLMDAKGHIVATRRFARQ